MKGSLRALAVVFALVAVVPGGAPALQSAVAATASVPNPTVIGPIASTSALGDPAHGYPFLASEIDLGSEGYVEEEYFVAGFARRYTTPPLATGEEIAGGGPYLTRLVVRRPADAKDFNGTLAFEWLNVTAQYDLEIDWFESNEHFMRRGWAWVGVSAQRVGVNALRAWSDRYSSLDGTVTPGDPMAFDVFAQAVQAVRSPVGVAPLGDLQVERVIATGHSQSAGRLATYYNSIHPLHGVVDGFVIHGSGSALRTDLDTKVMRVLAETDVGTQSTEPDNDHFRRWETSGTSHVGFKESEEYTSLVIRDRGSVAPRDCVRPPFSRVPFHYVLNAAYDNLDSWLQGGPAPSVGSGSRSTRSRPRRTRAATPGPGSASSSGRTSPSTPPPSRPCTAITAPTSPQSSTSRTRIWRQASSSPRTSRRPSARPHSRTSASNDGAHRGAASGPRPHVGALSNSC
jgi:Alpha/beta hydrolase domain